MVPPPPVPHTSAQSGLPRTLADDPAELLTRAARAVVGSDSLESLSRPLLELVHRITGLESAYLSQVDPDTDGYQVLFADNQGDLDITEGLQVSWQDSLCRQAWQGDRPASADAAISFPDSPVPAALGIRGFVSVPVVSSGQVLMGTLCSASTQTAEVSSDSVEILRLLARLLADQWDRDGRLTAERRRADNAENRVRSRATMLAEAEHKLKTPLTVIRGWSELMANDWDEIEEPRRIEGIRLIHESALAASQQVEQLLEDARGEVLSTELVITELDAVATVADLGRVLAGAAGPHHEVHVDLPEHLTVLADAEGLRQSLWHLAENALKYSPGGGRIELAVRSIRSEASGNSADVVEFSVRDHGLGVPADVDVFAPFVRGDHPAISGTGVGLHVVKTLVTAMNGTVAAAPAEGAGSIFTIRLPGPPV